MLTLKASRQQAERLAARHDAALLRGCFSGWATMHAAAAAARVRAEAQAHVHSQRLAAAALAAWADITWQQQAWREAAVGQAQAGLRDGTGPHTPL